MSTKTILRQYHDFLKALPFDYVDFYTMPAKDWFEGADYEPLTEPLPFGNYLVLPDAWWKKWVVAWESAVRETLSVSERTWAAEEFGTVSMYEGRIDQQINFLFWFIPKIRDYTPIYWMAGAAAVALVGGLVYTMSTTGGR